MAGRPLCFAALCLLALACGKGSTSPGDGGQQPGPLTAPTGLTATASSNSLRVALSWDAEAAATAGYQIWRSTGAAPQPLDTSDTNGYIDAMPPAGTSITYTVRAVDASGSSGDSNSATALTIPPAPMNLAASSIGESGITLTWSEAMGAAGGDEVSYVTGHETPVSLGATGSSFTAQGLLPATAYLFTVVARDATGSGPAAMATFTTLASGSGDAGSGDGGSDGGSGDAGSDGGSADAGSGGPGPGDAGTLSAYGSDSLIVLQWEDQSSAGAASYRVYRAHGASTQYAPIGSSATLDFADLGGSAHPIAAGDSYSYYVLPLDSGGQPLPASAAASARAVGVAVVESDRFVDDLGSTAVPADFSSGVSSATLSLAWQLVPALADGGPDSDLNDAVPSFGTSDGHAVFPGVPDAGYLLYASAPPLFAWLPARSRALDLSSSFVGRPQQTPGDATLDVHLTGLDPWDQTGDALQAFSWGADDSSLTEQPLDVGLSTPPADGGTTAIGTASSSALFASGALFAAAAGDVLYLLQEERDRSGSPYLAARKGLALSGLSLADGKTSSVTGTMVGTPSISETLSLKLDPRGGASAFLSYASAVNPSAAAGDPSSDRPNGAALIAAEPGFAAGGDYGLSNAPPRLWYGAYESALPFAPQLFAAAFPAGSSDLTYSARFTSPFPSRWDLFLVAWVPFTVDLAATGLGTVSVVGRLQSQGLLSSYVAGSSAQIAARLSPVTAPEINGVAANAAGNPQLPPFSAAAPLRFSWGPPAIGAPTRYTVSIWALDASGISGAPAVTLQSATTSALLPAGWLSSGTPYVAFITATGSDADRFGSGVLAYDGAADFADCVSSAFVVQ